MLPVQRGFSDMLWVYCIMLPVEGGFVCAMYVLYYGACSSWGGVFCDVPCVLCIMLHVDRWFCDVPCVSCIMLPVQRGFGYVPCVYWTGNIIQYTHGISQPPLNRQHNTLHTHGTSQNPLWTRNIIQHTRHITNSIMSYSIQPKTSLHITVTWSWPTKF